MRRLLKELSDFTFRGNVVDLAVAVVIGTAFITVVHAFVSDLLTPLITIPGTVNFKNLTATVHHSTFLYGAFLNDLITLIIVAAAMFLFVAKPMSVVLARRQNAEASTTRQCPECLSEIPKAARRCSQCTEVVEPSA